ncbi:unnamed protein product [Somion occarium]|uniref:Cytochrome P450 n=2 Tax=Somion occarium TaxID=3059160 RepID=A0ABP1D5V1_9APHY
MMDALLYSSLLGLVVWITVAFLRKQRDNPKRLPLPPGPSKRPVIGNLFDIPDDAPWVTFSSMAQKYGDIIHLKVLNQHTIIISSMEAASDLFDKRSAIYSDRFQSVMLTELMDMGWSFGLMDYGDMWRKIRKIFHQYYSASTIRQYDGLQLENVRVFLKRLHATPEKFFDHSRFVFAALLMNVTYGMHIEDEHNEHLVEAEKWQHGFNQAIQPGRFWVDYLPILKYIPAWMPRANFKRLALQWRQNMYHARDRPFDGAKADLIIGTATPSIVTEALESIADSPDKAEQELLTRYSLGAAFGAGVDTSAPTLQLFFYAMLTYPEIQTKAHAELDRVVGPSRLPTMDDRPNLPYVEAILKEVLRWKPVTPLALPHYTATSDEYRGYYIPKGSIVLGVSEIFIDCLSFTTCTEHIQECLASLRFVFVISLEFALIIPNREMLHDPVEYPCPDQFRPQRFLNPDGSLNPDVPDPSVACFGFGRRICPGRFLSLNSLFSAIAAVLHTFTITPALDQNGKPVEVELRMQSGMIPHPEPFPCSIQPRSLAAEALVTN